jgi:hypothetical protein
MRFFISGGGLGAIFQCASFLRAIILRGVGFADEPVASFPTLTASGNDRAARLRKLLSKLNASVKYRTAKNDTAKLQTRSADTKSARGSAEKTTFINILIPRSRPT